tara:strand:- start:1008 stop:1403 length:396 start_codon:yes stop_codon:yes gene_type:complete
MEDKQDKQYDNELKGFLWHETGSTVLRKGSIQIDGKELYSAIIKSKNNKGEEKYELMISAGLLHLNTEKKTDKSPDISGPITFNDQEFKFGGWRKISKENNEYTSVSLRLKEEDASGHREPFKTEEETSPF